MYTEWHVKRLGRRFRALFCHEWRKGTMTPYVFEVLKDGAVVDKRHQDLARFGD